MRTLWSAGVWWVVWLTGAVGLFILRETWALASGRPQDTLSEWVWRVLQITRHESITQWSATDFLVCGAWLVLMVWLTFHFFGHLFT